MANGFYVPGLQNVGDGLLIWISSNMSVVFIDSGVVAQNLTTHNARDDISSGEVGTITSIPGTLTNVGGVYDGGDTTLTAVSGAQFEQIVVLKNSGTPSTSWLLFGVTTATGLPLTPSGTDVVVQWDNTAGVLICKI